MLADTRHRFDWRGEGGPFDIIALCAAILIIAGGLFLAYAGSGEYRVVSSPALPVPVIVPWAAPDIGPVPAK